MKDDTEKFQEQASKLVECVLELTPEHMDRLKKYFLLLMNIDTRMRKESVTVLPGGVTEEKK